MLWTTLAFVLFTALLVARHVRKSRPVAVAPKPVPCPRCGIVVPTRATPCPKCGVPPQVFEVVAAPAAQAPAAQGDTGRLHAAVRADVCVGCGACVSVCPEPGAIALQGKLAVVDREACKGHGECVKACPVNGIFLTTGAAVQRVEVPEVSFDFESNVPGVFVVGELGGRGLIKNAINEGKLAAEAVARRVREGQAPAGSGLVHDVVIVGSGPAGLSAALACADRGLRYVVLEQGEAAESIRRYPRHKLLLAEPVELPVVGDLWVADATKEMLLGIWQNVIATAGIDIRTGQKVVDVKRESWGFHVVTPDASWPARHVILAMGRRGSPRKAEVPGEELPKVFYDVVEMEEFAGRRVLVVGGGDSAVESAIGLARQRGTTVHLSYRGEAFARIKERNREKLEEAVKAGSIRALLRSTLLEIREDSVRLDVAGTPVDLPNDDVIVRIGGEPPTAFLDRIGVRRVVKELAVAWLLAIGLSTGASAQVSPGPLSRAHADLEGNAGCLKCHGTRKDALDGRCLDCHREIGALREAGRGFHARDGKGACAACHPEHAGADFDLVDWPGGSADRFDHRKAGFPLEGKHAAQKCSACHQAKFRKGPIADLAKVKDAGRSHVGLEPACASCHADPHKGALGGECAKCHTAADWKTTPGFDHAKTAYPLEGKHLAVACAKCHLAKGADRPVYNPVAHAQCSDCHADPHAGRLGPSCAKCHVVAGFSIVAKGAFDHDRTRYPLRGAHVTVACAKCHDPKAPPGAKPAFASCAACHRDPHRGQATLAGKAVDCAACHTVQAFRPAVLPAAQHAPDRFPLEGKHAAVACAKCHVATPQGIAMRPAHARCADCHRDVHAFQPPRDCEPCHAVSGWVPSKVGVAEHARYALRLEGAHAKAKCGDCHRKPKLALVGVPARCDACHRDVHAFAPARDCAACHDATRFRSAPGFSHAKAAFPIEGAHAATPCSACHKDLGGPAPRKAVSFKDERRECAACHEDPHKGSLGKDCARCHRVASFRPAFDFDHDRDTKFRLGAAHRPVPCAKCHEAGRWKGTPVKCEACHGPAARGR